MNVSGKKVRLRDRRYEDSAREGMWELDSQVRALDPGAGTVFSSRKYSIETLDGQHIGSCALYNMTETQVQLGIRIGDRNYWGGGYGTEAVRLLVSYCFLTSRIDTIWLKVLPDNTRAIKSYEKCGFVHTGKLALNGYAFTTMEIRRDRWSTL